MTGNNNYHPPSLIDAAREIEAWWIEEGNKPFYGAPSAIFNLREAIEEYEKQTQPAPETGEWRVEVLTGRYKIYNEHDQIVATAHSAEDAAQIVSDRAAMPRLVEALKFQRQALAQLIDDFGVEGHPRLHASLANMRDDIDAALALTALRRGV